MMYMQVVNMAGSDGTNKGFYWLTLGAFGDLLDANMPGQKFVFHSWKLQARNLPIVRRKQMARIKLI